MDTNIQIFNNPKFGEIRTTGTSEEPLFCLADICRVLEIKNVSDCNKSKLKQDGVVNLLYLLIKLRESIKTEVEWKKE